MDRSTATKRSRPALPWKLIYFLRGAIILVAILLVTVFWLMSRVDQSEIRTQTVRLPIESRMLAAILPYQDQAWFFKMLGPEQAVATQRSPFKELMKSVRFDDETGQPDWTLPSGWRKLPDDAPQNQGTIERFATLAVSTGDEMLELSVTKLPYGEQESDGQGAEAYILANVNRWRKQLQLRELDLAQLAGRVEQLDVEDGTATIVELAGKRPKESMTAPPFAGDTPVAGSGGSESGSLRQPSFEAPDAWSSGGATSMSLASFQVQQDDQQVRVTVTPLPPSDLLANVNRWRSQIALNEIERDELDKHVKKITLGEIVGDYVSLQSPDQTILGVIAVHDGVAWFIKLIGDNSLAQRERERFEDFVRSFRFN